MTIYRILPDGRRRALPDGTPRSVGQPGPAGTAVSVAAGGPSFGGIASIGATVALAAAGVVGFGGDAQISSISVGPTAAGAVEFTGSATVSASAAAEASGQFAFDGAASGQVSVPIAAAGAVVWRGGASIAQDALIRAVPGAVRFAGSASGSLAAALRTEIGRMSFTGSATASVNTAAKWLSIWERVYASRQAVLNAVDANNRFLAKQAGETAQATADALVITNTRVEAVDDRLTAEAERTTLLTTKVTGLETSTGTALQNLQTTISQQGQNVAANSQAITAANAAIEGKASAEAVSTLEAKTTLIDGKVESQAQAITAVQTQAGNAATTAASALTAANGAAEAVTNVQYEVATPFTSDFGWEFIVNHRGFTATGAVLDSWPATANDGATVIDSRSSDPQFISPVFSLAGAPHPVVRALVLRRNSLPWDGALYWSNNNHGFSGTHVASTPAPPVGVWTVVEWDLRANADWRSGPLNRLRFDFGGANGATVDVKWIALGNYGQGRMAQATETMRAGVDSVTGRLNATYGFALSVDNKVIGMRAANDGAVGSIDFMAEIFRVISSGLQGFEIQNGYQRNYSNGAQLIIGHAFGAQQDLTLWYGPNIGAAACTKANATIWFDKSGNAYFGGMVAQGVLRYFNSSTATGLVAVTTEAVASNGKPVAVAGKFQYNSSQGWPGTVTFTPTSGRTSAIIVVERQYQGEGWVEIARRSLIGEAAAQNGTDGDGNLQYSVSGDVLVTDVASTKIRTYRTRVLNLSTGGYTTSAGTPYAPQINQYQSIESME